MAGSENPNQYDELQASGGTEDHTPATQVNTSAKGDSERKDQSRYGGTRLTGGTGDNEVDYFSKRDSKSKVGPRDDNDSY